MKVLLGLVTVYSLVFALSQIILKSGINQLGPVQLINATDLIIFTLNLSRNITILAGAGIMILSFLFWFYILSKFKLSIAYPLTATSYIFTVFLAALFLGEKLTIFNLIGTLVICFGVFVLLYKNQTAE